MKRSFLVSLCLCLALPLPLTSACSRAPIEEPLPEEDLGEDLEDTNAAADIVDTKDTRDVGKDVKKDVKDTKDTKDTGSDTADEGESDVEIDDVPIDDDVQIVGDVQDATGGEELPDGQGTLDTGPETAPDVAIDVPVEVDSGPDPCDPAQTKCFLDADCLQIKQGCSLPCVHSFLCVGGVPGAKAGYCLGVAKFDGAKCDDKTACTKYDHCFAGGCIGIGDNCDDKNPCTLDTCDPSEGCKHDPVPMKGKGCLDDNPCTQAEQCYGGKCNGVNACVCDPQNGDADCEPFMKGWNQCMGTLKCIATECVLTGVVKCDTSLDTACEQSTCDTTDGKCKMKPAFDGTPCDDGSYCTAPDICLSGQCAGTPVSCDDKNTCTTDTCDVSLGCLNVPNTLSCDDGDPCTSADACKATECTGTPTCECKTDADCVDDGDKCNGAYYCSSNKCIIKPDTVTPPCTKDAGNPCKNFVCEPTTGLCPDLLTAPNKVDGTPCDDKDATSVGDKCQEGFCVGDKINCDDGNPCTDDLEDSKLGCVHVNNVMPCDDGNPCTEGPCVNLDVQLPDGTSTVKLACDLCSGGQCAPGPSKCNCDNDDQCASLVTDKCKGVYKCTNKVCTFDPSTVKTCPPPADSCTTVYCNPGLGECITTKKADGSPCLDNDPCTIKEQCDSGKCTKQVNTCDDGNPCTDDACDPAAGGCSHNNNTAVCEDGDVCTMDDICVKGTCVATGKKDCGEAPACNAYVCDPVVGCKKVATAGMCEDGNPCTVNDKCQAGTCVAGPEKNCDDFNACTADTKDLADPGCCVHLAAEVTCNDGDACTINEKCKEGSCAIKDPLSCDDDNACTDDSCAKETGCAHLNNISSCDDKSVCTKKDTCKDGTCNGTPVDCNDYNVCTDDACDPVTGCVYTPAAGSCGPLAICEGTPPKCVFGDKGHLVISEVYIGVPDKPTDDWIELWNASSVEIDVGGFAIETLPAKETDDALWTAAVTFQQGTVVPPHRYLLVASSPKVLGILDADVVGVDLALVATGQNVRLRDVPHTLVHDQVAWGNGVKPEGSAAPSWPSARSLERKASDGSTPQTMFKHGVEWLQGNVQDTGDNASDFVVSLAAEPQSLKSLQYEPACGGTCSVGKICDYVGAGSDACVLDVLCSLGCPTGEFCQLPAYVCAPDPNNHLVISEIQSAEKDAPDSEFIEIYNAGQKDIDISGFFVQTRKPDAAADASWDLPLASVPAGTILPSKRYYVFATATFASLHGATDIVTETPFNFAETAGTVRLWNPKTNATIDRVGWGDTYTYDGKAAPPLDIGYTLERKASSTSTAVTMLSIGGTESLAGNGVDTDNNDSDFVLAVLANPTSLKSGRYEPACDGACGPGLACTFDPANEKCTSDNCGSTCSPGYACDVKSGKCSHHLVISEFATEGATIDDEFIEIFNPSDSELSLEGIILQWRAVSGCTGTCVFTTKVKAIAAGAVIAAHGYYLVGSSAYKGVTKADLSTTTTWGVDSAGGAWRIVHKDSTTKIDQVAYGQLTAAAEGSPAPAHAGTGGFPNGSIERKAYLSSTQQSLAPGGLDAYNGNAYDSDDNSKDCVVRQSRQPQSTATGIEAP